MAQIKIFARRGAMKPVQTRFSEIVHECVVEALQFPPEKRFHRFFLFETEDFLFPNDRGPRYTILEISLFSGRTVEAKKNLIRLLYARLENELDWAPGDLEITLFETPRENWGIRGLPGDEIGLNYTIEV